MKNVTFLKSPPIAHRGLHSRMPLVPENSLAACREAMNLGYAIEVDILFTRDNGVVVFHDEDLARMCGVEGRVNELGSDFIQSQALLGTSEKIPSLEMLLRLVDGKVPLIIELKSFDTKSFHVDGRLEAAAAKILSNYKGTFALKSFNPFSVFEMQRLLPNIPVGFLSFNYARDAEFDFVDAKTAKENTLLTSEVAEKADFISYSIDDLDDEISNRVRRSKPLMVWTVRTKEQYEKALRLADNVVFEYRGVPSPKLK